MESSRIEDFLDEPRPMGRHARKALARRERREGKQEKPSDRRAPLVAKNDTQADLIQALEESLQVFAIGPAGTGKTYIAGRTAVRRVLDGRQEKLMVARPTVSKPKHRLGFRPGKQDDKVADWLVPVMDGFKAECSAGTLDKLKADGKFEFLAFETLRGRSLNNAVIILDEAQNCDLSDLKLFLTRTGENSQIIICGDLDQVDIPDSGLEQVLSLVDTYDLSAEIIEFTEQDVVRSAIAREWVKAFSH